MIGCWIVTVNRGDGGRKAVRKRRVRTRRSRFGGYCSGRRRVFADSGRRWRMFRRDGWPRRAATRKKKHNKQTKWVNQNKPKTIPQHSIKTIKSIKSVQKHIVWVVRAIYRQHRKLVYTTPSSGDWGKQVECRYRPWLVGSGRGAAGRFVVAVAYAAAKDERRQRVKVRHDHQRLHQLTQRPTVAARRQFL